MKEITENATEGTKFTIRIKENWCKGCEICVEFCPTRALAMKGSKVIVKDIEQCNGCMLCELRCPDFCIFVDKHGKTEKDGEKAP